MKQLSEEWFEERRSLLTGSRVGKVVDGGHRAWNTLLDTLEKEKTMTGADFLNNQANAASLRHGNKYEPIAIAQFELSQGIELDRPAFITNSAYPGCGYSPDGVYPRLSGLVEVKCPYNPEVHAATVMYGTGAQTYEPQMQFGNMIVGTPFCDFISFDKRYPDPAKRLVIITVPRDNEYIEKMEVKIQKFLGMLESGERFSKDKIEIPNSF